MRLSWSILITFPSRRRFIRRANLCSADICNTITTFTIRFAPGASGTRTAAVSIANDDSDENPYSFSLTGVGTAAAEINLKQDTTSIADGGSYDFSSHDPGTNTDITFTVENTGTGDLVLSGSPLLVINGTNADQFSVQQQPLSSLITPSNSTTFILRFSPTSGGTKTASLTIHNNDADESEYNLILNGIGKAYPLTVTKNGLGSGTITSDPAGINCGSTCAADFDGNSTVTLTATPESGSKFGGWSGVCSGTQTTCQVTMTTAKTATATFTIPDINVKRDTQNIPNGGGTALHCTDACTTSAPVTFTIENTGDATLNLTSAKVVLTGDTGFFQLNTQNTSQTIASGGNTTFTIAFNNPGDGDSRLVTVTIQSDDPDENPYTFKVVGNPSYLLWTR